MIKTDPLQYDSYHYQENNPFLAKLPLFLESPYKVGAESCAARSDLAVNGDSISELMFLVSASGPEWIDWWNSSRPALFWLIIFYEKPYDWHQFVMSNIPNHVNTNHINSLESTQC